MQTVIDNILLNYEVYGPQNTKTILILHGWGQNILHWKTVAELLSADYKIFLVDLPGFGSSSLPSRPFGVDEYSQLFKKFINKLDIKELILIGHSVGGKIAIKIATISDNLDQLFLIAPSGIGKQSIYTKCKIIFFKFLKNAFFYLPEKVTNQVIMLFSSKDYINSGKLKDTFKKIVNENVEKEASTIKVKTTIIWGEKDDQLKLKNAKLLKKLINRSTLRVVWKVGHSPNIEAPQKLADLIIENI